MSVPGGVIEALAADEAKRNARSLHVFDLPSDVAKEAGFDALGFVELDLTEEIQAYDKARVAGATGGVVAHFLAMRSLAKVLILEGDNYKVKKTLDHLGPDGEVFYSRMPAQVRELAVNAYSSLHRNEEEKVNAFLQTRKVVTL